MGKFEYNDGFDREAANLDETKALLEELGLKVLAEAESNSLGFYRTGDWQDHLSGELKEAHGWPFYRVEDASEDAVYIEFGTSKTPAHRALGRAIGKSRSEGAVKAVKRVTKKQGHKAMQREASVKAAAQKASTGEINAIPS